MIEAQVAEQGQASIERMCELGKVSRVGFYRDWQGRQPDEAEVDLRDVIRKAALARRTSRLGREFFYLAVVLDVFSRRVVGWSWVEAYRRRCR